MPQPLNRREFAFALNDVARLLRICADHKAGQFGMSRAQWAVLARLERAEGLKQSELADMLDLQPITLTRLIDRLCDAGLVERRGDPDDRRAKRLFLTPAAQPVMDRLHILGEELMDQALEGLEPEETALIISKLNLIKDNLRRTIAERWARAATDNGKRANQAMKV
jgi:MarR family transcriptional regulator, transcriptional regulator for hemolysin